MRSHPTTPPDLSLQIGSLSRLSALVVDDEPPIRRLLSALLESLDLNVTICPDGREAWARLEEHPPDMLITDWMMPGTAGPDLIRRIRLSQRFPGLYIIMLTGRAAQADRVEGLEAGADDFLTKPFDEGEFRVRVRAGQRILYLRKQLLEQNRLLEASNLEMSKELRAAGNLQRAVVPLGPARIPDFDCAWAFHPYGQASGDTFGVFPLDEHHAGVFLVDVSGHGMAAAMLSFAISRLLCPVPGQDNLVKRRLGRPPYYEIVPPAEVLRGLRNWFERDENSGFYFTLIYAVLDGKSGDLEWVSAGHLPPIFVRGGECLKHHEQLSQTPIGLPIAPQGDDASNRATLAPGERVCFYSDGLVDLRDREGLWLPDGSLEEAIAQTAQLPIRDCVDMVIERLEQHSGRKSFEDDATLVALERRRATHVPSRAGSPLLPRVIGFMPEAIIQGVDQRGRRRSA